ncbi:integrin beta-PS-like isoform X2 [Anoplophora glabripennis]|uniref:integrin beta-PS-like isoform X2 n=1 Tax=Anoplophora glabripennis TaxID=217634 RepID=UPI000C78D0CD|nr:integrin beta-PS-like isoform X2 [Anoplophora glabripennis]
MTVPLMKYVLSNCLILCVISTIVIAQIPQEFTLQNPCTTKSNCRECIQTPSCAWCTDPEYKGSARCFRPLSGVISNKLCREEYVLNPISILSVTENLKLTSARSGSGGGGTMVGVGTGSFQYNETWSGKGKINGNFGSGGGAASHGRIVQVAPQRLSLKLRARETQRVSMYYSYAEGYPVDLYYLMDLSRSMKDDKENLYALGDQLASTMRKLTPNFKLGFGSFVDKVVMPYASTLSKNLVSPCEGCAAPYGFKHAMMLSTDSSQFSHMVKQANISGNLDTPEGGFDAIMQAIVCKNQIGWRDKARRLLVFSTDAGFHFAGDGKLGGIVKPNDGNCHLSHEGFYTQSSYQDYPSIGQINLSVQRNYINVIFAVNRSTIGIYKQLAKSIEGASVGELKSDSSNIVQLIKEQYQQISSTVEMKHNASSAVSLKFHSRCLDSTGALVNTNKCANIKVGDLILFEIDIEVLKCPKNRADHFQTIRIYPVGIDESLTIDLQMLCECDCEKPGHKFYQENSPFCSHRGTYKCGICECIPGAFGRTCECTSKEDGHNVTRTNCIDPKNPTGPECSGKGQCNCGVCECVKRDNDELIYGTYCECNNFSCERLDGKLCSDHGKCDCGKCLCTPEWTGPNCACRKSKDNCYPPDSNITCSGHGECVCGQCVCDYVKEGRYTGKFCEKCPTCSDRCEEFKDCVQCQLYKTGKLKDSDCVSNCTKFVPIAVEEVVADEDNNEILCVYYDDDECTFSYVYYFDDDNKIRVRAQ